MKLLKSIATGMLTLAFASSAFAQTVIYISGAPAFRKVGTTAIQNVLNANGGGYTIAFSGPTVGGAVALTSANAVNFYGGHIGATAVTIKVSYTGSTAGIQQIASGGTIKFLPTVSASSGAYAEPNTSPNPYEAHVADFTLSDDFQASTPFVGTNTLTGTPVTYQTLTDNLAGILPYKFVVNKDAPAGLNITPLNAQLLWTNGSIPLSLLTGNNADEGTTVYAVGRDIGSGLRVILLSEIGLGSSAQIVQYQPTIVSGNVTGQIPWPASVVNNIPLGVGDGGYSSFTGLLAALSANTGGVNGAIGGYYLTGLSSDDAVTAIAAGAKEVTWNGNSLGTLGTVGTSSSALSEGRYSFWSYIHVHYRSSLGGTQLAFATAVFNRLHDYDSTVLLKDVNVFRSADGDSVLPNF